jgi:hypothetical protein
MKLQSLDHDDLLIWLYLLIDPLFKQTELPLFTERLSNNKNPRFTDVELFTCALFTEIIGCKNKKQGFRFIRNHYVTWFPKLPQYEVYNRKLNKFHEALTYIFMVVRNKYGIYQGSLGMIDTAPITVCQAHHTFRSRTAQPYVSKGYCSAKKRYYIGAKLQIIAQKRLKGLPMPFCYNLETAAKHDLEIAKETLPYSDVESIDLYGDKAYIDHDFQLDLFENNSINLITPVKKPRGQSKLTLFQQAANTIHSSIRQTIDTLFGWINELTGIENASKVRSVDGLFYHVNVKMTAAMIILLCSI